MANSKREKDWTSLPNVIRNRETVEELCSSGDSGMDIAAFGAVSSACTKMNAALSQPAEPRFLYPTSRQFPFDEVTYMLVNALEERKFSVPGVKVNLDFYGPSNSYKKVNLIEGEDFRLRFGRIQRRISNNWNDTAAVRELIIPGKQLDVYSDNSGPTLYLYVGNNWENDKDNFINGTKVNSKLNKKPRTYLRYRGSCQRTSGKGCYPRQLAPFLTHDNDLGSEYEPNGKEPTYFDTSTIFTEFKEFLEEKLKQIKGIN